MKRALILLTAALLLTTPLLAASYTYTKTTVLNAATEVITVQLPGTARAVRPVTFAAASIYCSAECAITLERDGAAATATAGTITAVSKYSKPSIGRAYYSSDVGAGTALSAYTIPSGGTLVLDLSKMALVFGGNNLTVRFASMTGTVKVNLLWDEK